MVDFGHLRRLHVGGAATAEYEIVEVDGSPTLVGVFAGETNEGYYNALIRRSTKNQRRFRASKIGAKELQENRDQDRELFPKFVIKGWSNVMDSNGDPVEFSEENCAQFLKAIPDYLFDDVRNFFGNPSSFVAGGDDPVDAEDAEDLGNSSPLAFGGNSGSRETAGQ